MLMKDKAYLYRSTALFTILRYPFRVYNTNTGGTVLVAAGDFNGPLFLQDVQIECPALSNDQLTSLNSKRPRSITRHMHKDFRPSAEEGYFHIGTIVGYRPKDTALTEARLNDTEEGYQSEIFASRSGYFEKFDVAGVRISGIRMEAEQHIAVRYKVDEICSCSSLGDFDLKRGLAIRDHGNQVDSYVTYDLEKLWVALEEILAENTSYNNYRLIGMPVIYGKKDRRWEIEETYDREDERDPLAIYLATAFVKNSLYKHEDEFRLLIANPSNLGMPVSSKLPIFKDKRIKEAIIDCGYF